MKHSISEMTLAGGSKLLVIDVPNASSVFFSSVVRAGDYFAPIGKWELPHLLEHLVFLGNKKYPTTADFMFEVEKNGAYQNATTGVILVRYFYITGKTELFDIVPLALAQLNQPLFKKEHLESEKEVVLNELNRRYDRFSFLVTDANELLVNRRLKSTAEEIGSLENITRKDIVDYYKKTHNLKNTTFVVAGDISAIDQEKLVAAIEQGLVGYPDGEKLSDPEFLWGDYKEKVTVIEKSEANQDYFSFYLVSNNYSDELVAKARVFLALFNQGMYSRLPSRVRKLGLSYTTHSGVSLNKSVCKIHIEDQVHPKNSLMLFEEVLIQLKDLAAGNFTAKELERAKGYLKGGLETYYQLPQHFVSWYEYDYILEGRLVPLNHFLDQLAAVTKEDVVEAAQALIQKEQWCLSILGHNISAKEKDFIKIIKKYF